MYFFDTADYYADCMFGRYAHLGNLDLDFLYEDVFGGSMGPGTMFAFFESLRELLLSAKCPEGTECAAMDDSIFNDLMDAQLEFLKEAYKFWNMFKNPENWGRPNTGQIVHTGVVSTTIVLKNLASDTPDTISTTVNIDYGNALKSYAYIEEYDAAFKAFNCEIKKAVSYFTKTKFEMANITDIHYIDQADYDDYIASQP